MINVLINGRIKNKQKVLEYSHNILKHLMPRIRREVDVIIDIVKNIDDTDWLACCYGDKDEVYIEIKRLYNLDEMMLNLAHELVHAKQYITGQLDPDLNTWQRKEYKLPYRQTPWEREAYNLEEELYGKFK